MKFAYLFAIAVRAQGDGTPHDPEAMAYCQGKLQGCKMKSKKRVLLGKKTFSKKTFKKT